MIEAVNSVLSNAQLARGVVDQSSQARSIAANPERVQEVAKAPYVSPYIFMDVNFDRAVLQLRDADTGDVLRQYPSESQMQAYQRAQASSERLQQLAPDVSAEQSDSSPQPGQQVSQPAQTTTQETTAPVQAQTTQVSTEA